MELKNIPADKSCTSPEQQWLQIGGKNIVCCALFPIIIILLQTENENIRIAHISDMTNKYKNSIK